ncbi:hypothetical protein GCM10025876_33190 [Demequina litorisediminis]|uniref:Uncharacterized protein n=1 Tax=Demequina litorisediminis TaxID=1849022 RepID=A0ABQ6IH50_9MICO|nr:hypothetical protein GCM10025876_33190 [Demequina litorisediminis]
MPLSVVAERTTGIWGSTSPPATRLKVTVGAVVGVGLGEAADALGTGLGEGDSVATLGAAAGASSGLVEPPATVPTATPRMAHRAIATEGRRSER